MIPTGIEWNLQINLGSIAILKILSPPIHFLFLGGVCVCVQLFTMLCQFLLYSEVNQLYVYIYPLLFGFPSHLGHHRAFSRVPCAIQQVIISYLFYTQQHICVNPNLPVHPTSPSPLVVYRFVLYICVSISALQIGSSVPFFQIPHICVNIRCLFFSFWLISLCMKSLGPSTSLQMAQFCSFLWMSNTPLYICTTSSLTIPLLMDIYVASMPWLF